MNLKVLGSTTGIPVGRVENYTYGYGSVLVTDFYGSGQVAEIFYPQSTPITVGDFIFRLNQVLN